MKDSERKQVFDLTSKTDDNGCKPKIYESRQLFGSRNEIKIHHEGELYRIRITRNGKLIMNK